jgi:hypothetical protein
MGALDQEAVWLARLLSLPHLVEMGTHQDSA